jgi:amino acid transporter
VVLSFVIAAICCLFSAFSYAEFAARVPVSGSAYTFAYVCIGELAAWFVGWNLTLEYAISAAAVARGFSSNMILFCNQIGTPLPYWLVDVKLFGLIDHASPLSLILCLLCTAVLLVGVKESARVNMVITILNVTCILFIVILGSIHIDPQNWVTSDPHRPIPATCVGSGTGYFPCGFNGVLTGAAQVFFSFIGFDSVTTLAEELPDPKRDIPFGVISTLVIASILYTASSLVVTGMLPWNALDPNTPLASAFSRYTTFDASLFETESYCLFFWQCWRELGHYHHLGSHSHGVGRQHAVLIVWSAAYFLSHGQRRFAVLAIRSSAPDDSGAVVGHCHFGRWRRHHRHVHGSGRVV